MELPGVANGLAAYGYGRASAAAASARPFAAGDAVAPSGGGGMTAPAMAAQQGAGAEDIARDKATAKVMNDRFAQDCQTCKNRKYQDGSDDPGVSFQTPTHIDPGASASVVAGHEQEHVSRNAAKADAEGGEVVSSSVVLHGDICPECGKYYIAGGTTYTTTRYGGQQNPYQQQQPQGGGTLNATA